jgi:probable F420-dependent oxidoreductase
VKIGVGLPNPVPGTDGRTLLEWARRAEGAGFSSLATIDRIVYPSYESMITLAAAAAATSTIGLMTNVLLGPTRNPVLLAKEAASVDQLSGGRLTLGLGVGAREADFEAAERPFRNRGRRWDAELESMLAVWRGEPLPGADRAAGPAPVRPGGIPILFGGMSDQAVERTARWGAGWTAGGRAAGQIAPFVARIREAWSRAGREGEPRIAALCYFGLGDGAAERARAYLTDYYGELGAAMSAMHPMDAEAVRERIAAYREIGVDELIFDPTSSDPDQVEALAEVALG